VASVKGQNLGMLIGLVLSIIVIVILVFMVYTYNADLEKRQRRIVDLKDKVEEKDRSLIQTKQKLQNLNEVVHGDNGDVNIATLRKDYLDRVHVTLKSILEQEKFGGLSKDFSAELRKDSKITSARARVEDKPFKRIDKAFAVYERIVASLVPELNQLRASRLEADERAQQSRESARKEARDLEDQVAKLRQEKGRIENEKITQASAWDEEKRRLLTDKEQVQNEAAAFKEESFIAEARLKSEISQLNERIQQMTEKKKRSLEDTQEDGEIVLADHRLGKVWIDIGRKHHLRRGLTFKAFQYVKGGMRKYKGLLEVKKVEADHAVAAVVEEFDAADPIVKGDFIASPFYDKKKQMVFVFVGESLTNQRYAKDQLERRIRDFGGRVDDGVSIETDFVIAIRNAEHSPEFQKAVQFGTVIMREAELLEFLGQ